MDEQDQRAGSLLDERGSRPPASWTRWCFIAVTLTAARRLWRRCLPSWQANSSGPPGAWSSATARCCIIHRPDYEDWSLPRASSTASETHEQAALREVHEETGLRCVLGAELSSQECTDRQGRPKTVRWWAMRVLTDDGFKPCHEVDERRWVTPEQAERILAYEHDRELVREAVEAVAQS